jgi:hypothetical protein
MPIAGVFAAWEAHAASLAGLLAPLRPALEAATRHSGGAGVGTSPSLRGSQQRPSTPPQESTAAPSSQLDGQQATSGGHAASSGAHRTQRRLQLLAQALLAALNLQVCRNLYRAGDEAGEEAASQRCRWLCCAF